MMIQINILNVYIYPVHYKHSKMYSMYMITFYKPEVIKFGHVEPLSYCFFFYIVIKHNKNVIIVLWCKKNIIFSHVSWILIWV